MTPGNVRPGWGYNRGSQPHPETGQLGRRDFAPLAPIADDEPVPVILADGINEVRHDPVIPFRFQFRRFIEQVEADPALGDAGVSFWANVTQCSVQTRSASSSDQTDFASGGRATV